MGFHWRGVTKLGIYTASNTDTSPTATLFGSSNKPQQVNDTNLIAGLIVDVGWKGESF
jgi:hypothetical protein